MKRFYRWLRPPVWYLPRGVTTVIPPQPAHPDALVQIPIALTTGALSLMLPSDPSAGASP